MRSRPATAPSPPACQASKPSLAARKPERASASVMGLARIETKDSSNWVKASMPLAAISSGGQPISKSGSTMAQAATSRSSRKDFLKPSAPRRVSTAFFVASEPVPAVVGTAMNGVAGPR